MRVGALRLVVFGVEPALLVVLAAEDLRHQRLGRIHTRDCDLVIAVAERVDSRVLHPHGAGDLAGSGSGPPGGAPGSGGKPGDRAAGEEQAPGGEHQGREDVRAQPLEQRGRRPVERLPGRSTVLRHEVVLEVAVTDGMRGPEPGGPRREREQERRDHEHPAGVQRRGSLQYRTHHQGDAPAGEGDRREIGDPSGEKRQAVLEPRAHPPSVPAEIGDEGEKDPSRDQRQAQEVEMALLQALERRPGVGARLARGLARRARLRARARTGLRLLVRRFVFETISTGASTCPGVPLRLDKGRVNIAGPRVNCVYP